MTTLPDTIRQSELLNQLVLDRGTMEEFGRIEVMWMYPPAHRVLGFVCKSGFFGGKRLAFKLSQVEAIGANGILTHAQPDETDAERVRQLESLVQTEVWSNAGQKLGKIIDFVFATRTGVITDYLVVGDRFSTLTGSIYRLPPHRIVGLGRERVLVAETSIRQLTAYREGIQQKIAKVSTALRDEYEDVTYELKTLAKRAQETTQQTTGQIKTLAEQAKERAQLLAEQAKERAQELNEQLLENAQAVAEKAREASETWVERVQDTTDEWGEPFKQPPTVTVPAQEIADLEEDWDWDEDLFEEDNPAPASAVAQVKSSSSTSQGYSPPPAPSIASDERGDKDDQEDFWVIGEDLTLKRPSSIAQDQIPFVIDDNWDIDDDPWDITEPPVTETPVSPMLSDEAAVDLPETVANSVDETSPSDRSDATATNDEEPWV
jgi:uncharacterized protein YrrD